MGVMRFLIHPAEMLDDWLEVYRAYISGSDGRIFQTRIEIDGPVMNCRRPVSESGRLHVAWPVPGFGRPVLPTGTLPEREKPYLLAVELARGKLVQVRNQCAAWDRGHLPNDFRSSFAEAHRLFAGAATVQNDPATASDIAREAIVHACQAAERLATAHAEAMLVRRQERYPHLPVSLGCQLGAALPEPSWNTLFPEAFQSAAVPVEWKRIEPVEGNYQWDVCDAQLAWCESNRLMVRGGPLLDLSPEGLPAWLWLWERDFLSLQSFVCDFVETAISRYIGRIRLWEVAARGNTGGALTLSEEHRLALVARVVDVARQVDEESQIVIRVDQPWGAYQARGHHRLAPLQFVDALLRSGAGLSLVNLEISVGYRPRGESARDLLEFSRLIDLWAGLGVPLHITLAFPSGAGPDPHSHSDLEVEPNQWKLPWSEEAQAEWIDACLPVLLSKQSVVGVFWTHFSDVHPHEFPHAGLLRPDGTAKPALATLVTHRERWMK